MPRRMLCGAALLLLVTGSAHTQNKTYTVRKGDTLSTIASKIGVKSSDLAKANRTTSSRLKPGLVLRVPAQRSTSQGYVVVAGDNDWTIAKKLKVTVAQLHAANPGLEWPRLKPGQTVKRPTSQLMAEVAAKYNKRKPSGGYLVQAGDSDWTIAKKHGIAPSRLRAINPGVNWKAIQIGQRINVPGAPVKAPEVAKISSRYAVVTTDDVTIRKGPDVSHPAITTVDRSTQVTILDTVANWYKLKFPGGTIGWVRGDFLKGVSATKVVIERVAARKKPGAAPQTRVAVVERRGSRASRLGRTAAPKGLDLTVLNSAASSSELISRAKSMLGVPYRYGAMSRSAVDCSGFTSVVYRSVGKKLPRTSGSQARVGTPVSRSALQRGDLIFFRTRGGRLVGHVGIYIGSNKFIHAPSTGGRVRVDSISGYYSQRYLFARRVAFKSSGRLASNGSKSASVAKRAEPKAGAATQSAQEKPAAGTEHSTRAVDDIGK